MGRDNMEKSRTHERHWIWLVFLAVFVIALCAVFWYWIINYPALKDWEERSQFGQTFGALNALFSGFAFAGIAYTLYLQTKQISILQAQRNASIIFELTKMYHDQKISEAIYYLKELQSLNADEFKKNPYEFGRKYIEAVRPNSEQWRMRKTVSSFFGDIGVLLDAGMVDEDVIFHSYGINTIEIVKFLEPIETAIVAKYYKFPAEYPALRLLERAETWEAKQKINPRLSLPRNKKLFDQSRNVPEGGK